MEVAREEKLTPDIEMIAEKMMAGEEPDPKKREEIRQLYNTGVFSKKKLISNPKVEKIIDQWYAREINKAIRQGRLPKKGTLKDPFINKMKEYGKNQNGN